MDIHIFSGREVITYQSNNIPLGVITGTRHLDLDGFEVDWIIRFPEAPSGTGEKMCAELLPKIVEQWNLKWIIVKIHDAYKPEYLETMARRFGFVYHSRQGRMTLWRKDCV